MLAERPIGCFLSGGLDSSLCAAIIKKYFLKDKEFHTFSIGSKSSPDLKYAKMVADHIGSVHHEIIFDPD